ncbi:MAG: T9SS type A sorting domain-containing protein [Flavobacteriaceae bacterium]|jgi:hypothetical protein|nr:T9SS type A sorting domain-containing protein [Flavobacteriaceae bacterium]
MKKTFILLALMAFTAAFAQWTNDYGVNTLVANSPTADIVSTGTNDGKTYVVYWDETAGANDYVLKVQLLDKDGNQLFGNEGMLVSDVAMSSFTVTRDQAVDDNGNIYISFTSTGDGHGYAHKISPAGEQLWGTGGIDLGENAFDTKILPDGNGGAFIGWYGGTTGSLMRYDATGNPEWSAVKVLTSPNSNPYTSVGEMVRLSDGSFIVLMHVRGGFSPNSMFWAQRYDADGTALWANAVQVSNQTTVFNRRYPVLQDGDVTYLGYYGSTGFRFDSFLQRINADGTLPWGINGSDFRLDGTHYEMETGIAFQENSDYVWSISRVTDDLQNLYSAHVQKFDKNTGARMFTDDAKQLFPTSANSFMLQGNPQMVDNKLFFLGSTGIPNGVSPIQLFVSYLDENGDFVWSEQYRNIATTATDKGRIDFTKNVGGQSVAVWTEDRGSGSVAYAQNYKIEDETAAVNDIANSNISFYPNPVKDILNITAKKEIENVEVFNMIGQKVMNLSKISNGKISVSRLTSGIYLFKVKLAGGQIEIFKIVKD